MRIVFSVILIVIGWNAFSQGQIDLRVLDEENNPIEYANFRLFSQADSAVVAGGYSAENGNITLENIPYGTYYAILTFFGFEEHLIQDIQLDKNTKKLNLGKAKMRALKSQDIEEVVIKGETKLMESSIDKRSYNVEEDMTAVGGGLTEVLNNIP